MPIFWCDRKSYFCIVKFRWILESKQLLKLQRWKQVAAVRLGTGFKKILHCCRVGQHRSAPLWSPESQSQRISEICFTIQAVFSSTKSVLFQKKIPRHIKLAIHVWSNKCRWNQKLIVQFGCTLRDERFEPN
jgi:hypothetical protein